MAVNVQSPPETVQRLRASMLGPERPEMLAFLKEINKKIRIAACTNTIELHWSLLTDPNRYQFPQLFEAIFASHLIGEAKPTRQSFTKVLGAVGLSPEEVVFVDDSALNVSGASQLGIKAIVLRMQSRCARNCENAWICKCVTLRLTAWI